MAYGIKYTAPYKRVDGVVRTINLKEDGFTGDPILLYTGEDGLTFEYGGSDSLFGNTICTSQVNLTFLFEQEYELTSFVENVDSYICEIIESGAIIWSGFIEPWNASHIYRAPNYFVNMTASCGLSRLAKKPFNIDGINPNPFTYWEVIQRCLSFIGIDRESYVSIFTTQNGWPAAPNPLTSVKIELYRYNVQGEWMSCDMIVKDILNKFNAEIFIWNNKYIIRGIVDFANNKNTYAGYNISGSYTGTFTFPELSQEINGSDDILSLDGSSISVQGSIRKYVTTVDLGMVKQRLENGYLQLWNDFGLLGWNFNMIESTSVGWEKLDTGADTNPYALRINGFAPAPFTGTKKVNGFWFFKKKVTVYKEPVAWIATPDIEIKDTDNEITVSFDYYTEGENPFYYSAYIHSANPTDDRFPEQLWYKPSVAFTAVEDFIMHEAPSRPLESPVTGVVQSKATIDIKFNPTVAATQFKNGQEYKFDYIVVRFYKTIDKALSGDSYTIFNIKNSGQDITGESFDATEGDGLYTVKLEHILEGSDNSEEIPLISGDYTQDFIGATFTAEDDPTGNWKRRDNTESMSIYRAMMLDRLCMTWKPLNVFEGSIKIPNSETDIHYLHKLLLSDIDNKVFKVVRYSFEERRRIATVTAIQMDFEQMSLSDVTQKMFTSSRGLLGETEDGIYPEREIPEVQLTDPDADSEFEDEVDLTNVRVGVLFSEIEPLEYIVAIESEDEVDLSDYFSQLYLDGQTEDVDIEYRHDPASFVMTLTDYPSWMKPITVDGLVITATAKAPTTGTFYLYFDVYDAETTITISEKVPVLVTENEEFIEEWPPVFIELPTLYFIVEQDQTREILLTDYLDPDGLNDGTGLTPKLISKPYWVVDTSIAYMNLLITGNPDRIGTDYVSYILSNAIGQKEDYQFAVVAIESTPVDHSLILVSDLSTIGGIPSSYELPLSDFDIKSEVSMLHDKVIILVNKGTDPLTNILISDEREVSQTNNASYRAFLVADGIAPETGIYRYEFKTFIGDSELSSDVVFFTFYDDEYLAENTFELWGDSGKIGNISIDGSTEFYKPDSWDVKDIISDIEHDKVVLELSIGGSVIKTTTYTLGSAVIDGEYLVYDSIETDQLSGLYTINAKAYNGASVVMERQTQFTILTKDPEPTAGVHLVEMIPNTSNYTEILSLPLTGADIDLPTNGWNAYATFDGLGADTVTVQVFEKNSNAFIEVNVPLYTKKESNFVYLGSEKVFCFRTLSSLLIDSIHTAPSMFRLKFTARKGGEIVGIKQADVSFRVPVAPEDLTGLQLWIYRDGVKEVVDANMPITGRTLALPTFPDDWSIAFLKTKTGELFDEVQVKLKKDGVVLYNFSPDLVMTFTSASDVTEIPSGSTAYIYGTNNVDGLRYLNSSTGNQIIDEEGVYEATFIVKLDGVIIETITTTLTITTPLEETPEKDCCEINETQIFPFTSATSVVCNHNLDGYPEIDIIIGGERWDSNVTYNTTNTLTVNFKRPKTGFIRI